MEVTLQLAIALYIFTAMWFKSRKVKVNFELFIVIATLFISGISIVVLTIDVVILTINGIKIVFLVLC